MDEIAELINSFQEVNHNYEREHAYNLWFVVIASSQQHLQSVLDRMEEVTGFSTLCLPMLKEYHINLGFKL